MAKPIRISANASPPASTLPIATGGTRTESSSAATSTTSTATATAAKPSRAPEGRGRCAASHVSGTMRAIVSQVTTACQISATTTSLRNQGTSADQLTGTPVITTAPLVGSSSVAWLTPLGVSTSIALGRVAGSSRQIGLLPPAAHTPKL